MPADLDELWRTWDRTRAEPDRTALIVAAQANVTSSVRNVKVPAWCDREDLMSEGQFGLFDAIDRYSPAKGANFSTFANRCIRFKVLEYIRGEDWAPKRIRKEGRDLKAAELEVSCRHGRPGTDAEVAAELGIDEDELVKRRSRNLGTLIYSYSDHGDPTDPLTSDGQRAHAIAAPQADDVLFEMEDVRARIAEALTSVTEPQHRVVLALYFVERLTGPEIAKVMGISKGQVSKLRDQAVLRLRDGLERQRQ